MTTSDNSAAPTAAPQPFLGEFAEQLGGRVDELWEQKQRIIDAVEFVWSNREALMAAVTFTQTHADDLIALGQRLPELLCTAGKALDTAGDGAQQASRMLLGERGRGVHQLATDAADALERCQSELWNVMGMLDETGSGLASLPVIGDVAKPLVAGAGKVGVVAGELGEVAARLRELGVSVTDAGRDLGSVGVALSTSGATMQQLTSASESGRRPATRSKSRAAARKPAKRSAKPRP